MQILRIIFCQPTRHALTHHTVALQHCQLILFVSIAHQSRHSIAYCIAREVEKNPPLPTRALALTKKQFTEALHSYPRTFYPTLLQKPPQLLQLPRARNHACCGGERPVKQSYHSAENKSVTCVYIASRVSTSVSVCSEETPRLLVDCGCGPSH